MIYHSLVAVEICRLINLIAGAWVENLETNNLHWSINVFERKAMVTSFLRYSLRLPPLIAIEVRFTVVASTVQVLLPQKVSHIGGVIRCEVMFEN